MKVRTCSTREYLVFEAKERFSISTRYVLAASAYSRVSGVQLIVFICVRQQRQQPQEDRSSGQQQLPSQFEREEQEFQEVHDELFPQSVDGDFHRLDQCGQSHMAERHSNKRGRRSVCVQH